jgi:hypothetical protein
MTQKRYEIVGWYSHDPHNPHVMPFARVVEVMAETPAEAFDKGAIELERVYHKKNESVDFLNWFIKELK